MTVSSLPADIRGSDLALAAALTVAVFGGSLLALLHARLEHSADVPGIDPGGGMAIAVRPVADLPSGSAKQGDRKAGKKDKRKSAVVPSAWRRKVPRASPPTLLPDSPAPPVEPEPAPEPTDAQTVPMPSDDVPPEPAVDPEAPPQDPATEPSPTEDSTDAPAQDTTADAETPEGPPVDEGGEGQPDAEGQPDGAAEGGGQQDGEGQQDGATEGQGGGDGTDPLLERAIAFYRARLVAWFSSRFRVTGSGLSSAQLAKYRVRVHIEVGEDLRIVDFEILSSDHPDFEAAARSMLEKLRGAKLPAPPENYPGAVQRQLTVTFTCAPDSCD